MDYGGKSVPIFICEHLNRINNMLHIKPTLNPTSFQIFPTKKQTKKAHDAERAYIKENVDFFHIYLIVFVTCVFESCQKDYSLKVPIYSSS